VLTGPIPSLAGLTNLDYVFVGGNGLTGVVPPVPGPGTLMEATLCPNLLDLTPSANDADWNLATGFDPWWGEHNSRCDILLRNNFGFDEDAAP